MLTTAGKQIVVVIDSNELPRSRLLRALESVGAEVEVARSAAEALDMLAERLAAVVIIALTGADSERQFLAAAIATAPGTRRFGIATRRDIAMPDRFIEMLDDLALPPHSRRSLALRLIFLLRAGVGRLRLAVNGTAVNGSAGSLSRFRSRTLLYRTQHRSTSEPKAHSPQSNGRLERAALHRHIAEALAARTDSSPLFAVLLLDIDRFKSVNFSLGHVFGDLLLDAVARRLRATVRGPRPSGQAFATIALLGGDRFALLLEGLHDTADAVRVAKRIQESFHLPFVLSGREVFATACIGIATVTESHQRPEDLLRDADAAEVRAKATGPGSIAIFDAALARQTASRASLEAELLRAVAAHELSVHYQPIVTLADGRLVGFEALARWSSGGISIPPSEFVPVAEDMGIIVDIDRYVLREVCRQIHAWDVQFRTTLPLWVAINLSGKHFLRADTLSEIDRAVRSFGIWGRRLKVEITESAIMEHAAFAEELLRNLKALDIAISIDDFGTGYSSLAYLQRFAIDTLKIDYSFIQRMDVDHENWEIVRAIVSLGNNLGKGVVAEGIERVRQRDLLQALRCEFGQGNYFSPATDATTAAALIASHVQGKTMPLSLPGSTDSFVP